MYKKSIGDNFSQNIFISFEWTDPTQISTISFYKLQKILCRKEQIFGKISNSEIITKWPMVFQSYKWWKN